MYLPEVVLVEPKAITIKWQELNDEGMNGGDSPNYYMVEWYSYTSMEWLEVSNIADGKKL